MRLPMTVGPQIGDSSSQFVAGASGRGVGGGVFTDSSRCLLEGVCCLSSI